MMKRIITTAIWMTMFLLVVGGIGSAQAEKVIKVGIVDCYTGPASTYTNDVRDAFKLATDKINAKGGVMGRKIEFVTRDS